LSRFGAPGEQAQFLYGGGGRHHRTQQAVEALRESQALYHSLVEQMPAGIFRKDGAGRYVFVSESFCQLKAMTPEQFLGRTAFGTGFGGCGVGESGAGHHVQIMENGKQIEVEEENTSAQMAGVLFPRGKNHRYFDAAGKITGSQGVLFDATARKLAEVEAREFRGTVPHAVQYADRGVCTIEMIFDAAGKPVDYRFLEVNPAFEKQTGMHGAQGKLMRDLAPNTRPIGLKFTGKSHLTGESLHFRNEAKALGRYYDVHAYRIGDPKNRKSRDPFQ